MTVTDPLFTKKSPISPEEEVLQGYCKHLLKSKIFTGFYKERRLCSSLQEYRDVIVLDETEKELKSILQDILQRLTNYYANRSIWIGITATDEANSISLWTEVEDLAFESYWFQIRTVKFRDNEIIVKLKPMRSMNSDTTFTGFTNYKNDLDVDFFINLMNTWLETSKALIHNFFEQDLTKENVFAAIKFLFLLLVAALTFFVEALKLLGSFSIKFMTEFRLLLRTSTPIILTILNMLNKMIGGIYLLVAMIWKDVFGTLMRINKNNNSQPAGQNAMIANNANRPFQSNLFQYDRLTDGSRFYRENNRRRFL